MDFWVLKNKDLNLKLPFMTIGQALKNDWRKKVDRGERMISLLPFLQYNYNERYVSLCERVNVVPVSFSKWLLRPVESI